MSRLTQGMRALIALCLAALASAGCAGRSYGTHYDVSVSSAFSQGQLADADAALSDWSNKVPVRFDVKIQECPDPTANGAICIHPILPGDSIEAHGGVPGVIGLTEIQRGQDGGDVWVLPEYSCPGLYGHELGHALGLSHEAESEMAPLLNDEPPGGADCRDVSQFYSLRPELGPAPDCSAYPAATWGGPGAASWAVPATAGAVD